MWPQPCITAKPDSRLNLLWDNLLAFCLLLVFSFFLLRWLPGDPLLAIYVADTTAALNEEARQTLREQAGLTGSVGQQFVSYLQQLVQGNLGFSSVHAAPVTDLIGSALPWSLSLILLSLPLALLLGALPGLMAGMYTGRWPDRVMTSLAALFSSVPSFALSLLLLSVFALLLGWFPLAGGSSILLPKQGLAGWLDLIWHGVLPLLALSLHTCIRFFYLGRGLAQNLSQRPFIFYAQARGICGRRLFINYYARNALPELLAKLGSVLPGVVGSTLFIEVVFSYPGIGQLLLGAINTRDFPLVQGILLVAGLIMLLGNSLLDGLISLLNRRG